MKSLGVLILVSLIWTSVSAQEAPQLLINRAPEARPSLLVLGSVHLHNPGRDAIKREVDDVLAPARQAQLEELVNQLAAYKPTHIAIEHIATEQAKVDELYRSYREGKRALDRDEEEQIGMRLAAKLGHERVYAVDWNGMPPGDFSNYDFSAYVKKIGQEARLKALLANGNPVPDIQKMELIPFYLTINEPEMLARMHRVYYDIAMLGDANLQAGANWVGTWYARNLKIFANLVNLTDKPEHRVLAIYGASHGHPLRQFAAESGAFRLREVSEFVKPAKAP
jgi:hypothetical protein